MSQSPAITLNSPPPNSPSPMKKKIIIALTAVVIGHVGALWAVSQMKSPELPRIEKKPLNVRFVKIQAPPPALPKPEPKKEPPKPKKEVKEVKVVEKAAPPPPKKVEKVQQVKKAETPKQVTKVEPKVDPKPLTTTTTTVTEKVVERAKPAPQPQPQPAPQPQVSATPSPKSVSIGGSGVQWSRSPRPSYTNSDLKGETRTIIIMIEADESGKITNARVSRSSGVSSLDDKILRAVRSAKFKPYKENGVAYPIRAEQPFELTLNPNG